MPYKTTRSDDQGRFSFLNLDPGESKVFSWDSVPAGAYQNAAFISQYEEKGTAVTVVTGGRTSVDAAMISLERKP